MAMRVEWETLQLKFASAGEALIAAVARRIPLRSCTPRSIYCRTAIPPGVHHAHPGAGRIRRRATAWSAGRGRRDMEDTARKV
jgi:hypothetical protein